MYRELDAHRADKLPGPLSLIVMNAAMHPNRVPRARLMAWPFIALWLLLVASGRVAGQDGLVAWN